MFGAIAVKHIAIDAKSNPPKKATNGNSKNRGLEIKPKAPITANTIVALIKDRVAPQSSSPATTSSTLIGVATIASKVFWKYIRTNDAKVHSKKDPFITAIATKAGPRK